MSEQEHGVVHWRPEEHPILETTAEYDLRRRTHLTSHALRIFRRCPREYAIYRENLRKGIPEPDTDEFRFGRALHCYVLEGHRRFQQVWLSDGPKRKTPAQSYTPRSKAWQAWRRSLLATGRDALTREEAEMLHSIVASLNGHEFIRRLLDGITSVEQTMLATVILGDHEAVVPVQVRPDALSPTTLLELKTCRDLDHFESDVHRYGYLLQLALYETVLRLHRPEWDGQWYMVACEKSEPYRVGVWRVDDSLRVSVRTRLAGTVWYLLHCEATDTWPTGYEECRILK